MAKQKLKTRVHIELDGKPTLWYEIDENGSVTWHLPKTLGRDLKNKMLNSVGQNMSRYINVNRNSSLWAKQN